MPACDHDESAVLAAELLVAHRRIAQLEQAVESHGRIGQALGVLMCRYAIGADAAFRVMTRVSQHHNVKLRQLADAVIDVVACRDTSIPDNLGAALEDLLPVGEWPGAEGLNVSTTVSRNGAPGPPGPARRPGVRR